MTETELLNVILRDKRHEQQLSFAVAQAAVSVFMVRLAFMNSGRLRTRTGL